MLCEFRPIGNDFVIVVQIALGVQFCQGELAPAPFDDDHPPDKSMFFPRHIVFPISYNHPNVDDLWFL